MGTNSDSDYLVGAAEVAASVRLAHPISVTACRHRHPDSPTPVVDLSSRRVRLWRRQDIEK